MFVAMGITGASSAVLMNAWPHKGLAVVASCLLFLTFCCLLTVWGVGSEPVWTPAGTSLAEVADDE